MAISLLHCLSDIPLAVIDVETTGISVRYGHRVTEVAVARVQGGQVVARHQQLVNPMRKISPGVTALTGITQQMVDGQPTFAEQLPAMLPLVRDAVVLGHNVWFDLSFLQNEFRLAGRDLVGELGRLHVLDTVRIARRRFGRRGNGLQQLCRRLGYSPAAMHRAWPDVVTTLEVFVRLIEPAGGWKMSLCDAMMKQGGPMTLGQIEQPENVLPVALQEAMEQRCAVMMEYLDAHRRRTRRIIEPIELRQVGSELMLVAFCRLRNDRRYFKLDRIVQLSRIDGPQLHSDLRMESDALDSRQGSF